MDVDRDARGTGGAGAPGRASDDVETVRFGIDGMLLEIDLDAAEARAVRAILRPYAEAGRRIPATGSSAPVGAVPPGERAAARAWLEANGHRVGERGRISATLMMLYRDRDHG